MSSNRIFAIMVIISIGFHAYLIAQNFDIFKDNNTLITKIPVVLEQKKIKPPPPPPPPPKPKPKPKHKPKPKPKTPVVEKKIEKPKELRKEITKVEENKDCLRSGELVDAPTGEYQEGEGTGLTQIDRISIIKEFLRTLRKKMAENKEYPAFAQRFGITGKVKISFIILENGTFDKISVKKSSKNEILDKAAINTVKNLSGKLKRPMDTGIKPIKTSVILNYQLST